MTGRHHISNSVQNARLTNAWHKSCIFSTACVRRKEKVFDGSPVYTNLYSQSILIYLHNSTSTHNHHSLTIDYTCGNGDVLVPLRYFTDNLAEISQRHYICVACFANTEPIISPPDDPCFFIYTQANARCRFCNLTFCTHCFVSHRRKYTRHGGC